MGLHVVRAGDTNFLFKLGWKPTNLPMWSGTMGFHITSHGNRNRLFKMESKPSNLPMWSGTVGLSDVLLLFG